MQNTEIQSNQIAQPTVRVRFDVDSNTGKPTNIQVVQPNNAVFDREVIKILQNSTWKVPPGARPTGEVQVPANSGN